MFLKDSYILNKTSPIKPPLITNKGRKEGREVKIGEITNIKGAVNNPTLLKITELMPLHRTPNVHLDLGRTLSCRLTICVPFATFLAIIHTSSP